MNNLTWHDTKVTQKDRKKILKHPNRVIWFTGLSGSGKSTLANVLDHELNSLGILSYVLDGDNIRHGLNKDLGFSEEDRNENIRRITEVAELFHDAGVFVIVAFISPYRKIRDEARKDIGEDFVEVHVKCSLEECEKRDTKGLYKKARQGLIDDFTGISAPYEEPLNPEIIVDTEKMDPDESIRFIMEKLGLK